MEEIPKLEKNIQYLLETLSALLRQKIAEKDEKINMNKLYNISETSKILDLIDPSTKKPLNHVLRYWEKVFKEIKPKKINNRRYYTVKQIEIIKMIKFLLKNKGMTINGVKNLINLKINKLDYSNDDSLKAEYYKNLLKTKANYYQKKLKRLENMAKKTHLKVRMVPESNSDSKFIYYAKKPTKGEKAKEKLKLKKYNPNTRKHEFFVEKNYHLTANNYFF